MPLLPTTVGPSAIAGLPTATMRRISTTCVSETCTCALSRCEPFAAVPAFQLAVVPEPSGARSAYQLTGAPKTGPDSDRLHGAASGSAPFATMVNEAGATAVTVTDVAMLAFVPSFTTRLATYVPATSVASCGAAVVAADRLALLPGGLAVRLQA